jgi:hypothetical protein
MSQPTVFRREIASAPTLKDPATTTNQKSRPNVATADDDKESWPGMVITARCGCGPFSEPDDLDEPR